MQNYKDSVLTEFGNSDGGASHHQEHLFKLLGLIGFMVLLILYITIGSYMEVRKFAFGHETGVIIILGALCSIAVYSILIFGDQETFKEASENVADSFKFPNEIFFEVLLPLIIFATGYNMRRQKFFENFTNISKFGLLGTFLTFVFFTIMVWLLFQYNDGYLWAYDFDA